MDPYELLEIEHVKACKKFIQIFKESMLSNFYKLEEKYSTKHNGMTHLWDFGIFGNNGISMVIDIHIDSEYNNDKILNMERQYSINGNTKAMVLSYNSIFQDFKIMIKYLMDNYDSLVKYLFELCRVSPFPYPSYDNEALRNEYKYLERMDCNSSHFKNIALNTRVGDRIIQHFHHSIWHAKRRGELSPYEAWYDDNLLMKVIENRIIYKNNLTPNKILQGFNISKVAQKVSVFSAARAKLIINKYLSSYDIIFDPFSGFSGRMLGTVASGKKYIGHDISPIHINESQMIIDFYKLQNVELSCKDVLTSNGEYPCLFTCSPYSDIEQWKDVPINKMSCDDWIDVCLNNFKCSRYVFVADNTVTKYRKYIHEILINKSHLNKNTEVIIVINREG